MPLEVVPSLMTTPDAPELPETYIASAHRGKRSYRHKHDAKVAARRTSATFGGEPKVAYRCAFCGLFHVGRDPR